MARLNGIISNLKGSAGSLTFKSNGGQTVVSEKITKSRNAKTAGQLKQRMKWPNIIRFYQVMRGYLKHAFGGSINGRNDYNKFVSANLSMAPVYLTKAEANAGGCIVAPYEITQGTIKSIVVNGKGSNAVTNISMGGITIDASTTVAEFSNAVVQNNELYAYGDQITFFLVNQEINEVTSMPLAEVDACCIVLSKTSEAKLLSLVDDRGFAVQKGCLAAKSGHDFGDHGMVWIHSRNQNGKTVISTQFLICENVLLTQYQGSDAYQLAVNSYGGMTEIFLSPGGKLSATGSAPSDDGDKPNPPAGGTESGTGGGSSTPSGGGSNPGGSGTPEGSDNTDSENGENGYE